jgi:hypothetical protein
MIPDPLQQISAISAELEHLHQRLHERRPVWQAAVENGTLAERQAALEEAEAIERQVNFYDRSLLLIRQSVDGELKAVGERAIEDAGVAIGDIILMADDAEARNKPVLAASLRSLAASLRVIPDHIARDID